MTLPSAAAARPSAHSRVRYPYAQELANAIARALLEGFDKHYRIFRKMSRDALGRFERADWPAVQRAHAERIALYDERVREAAERLQAEFDTGHLPETLWQDIKLQYVSLLTNHRQPELAETFFNSVSCRLLNRTYFNNDCIFVRPAVSTEYLEGDPPAYRSYYPLRDGLRAVLAQIRRDTGLSLPFRRWRRDGRWLLRALREALPRPLRLEPNHQIQVLSSLFFRNKRCYLIGRVVNGHQEKPFAVPIVHDGGGGLTLDACLLDSREIAPLFAFSRAYLMADMDAPAAWVDFLAALLPGKPKAELYTALGLQKHGKTLFFRDFLHHLAHSTDEFVLAPGIKGLVMIVFTLPSYPYVFKVIRDRISPTKDVTHETVREKYMLVKRHDRIGRMADTLEYADVAFPLRRFSAALLDELRREVPSLLEETDAQAVVKHLYIERRMTPLNLYLDEAGPAQLREAVLDYGRAIKELCSVNIFPGDMLFKNFGVTRGGRVVFYDYDEIAYMSECNFLRIPPPPTPEAELSAEPWYPVGPNDIFPEEFAPFLLTGRGVREAFLSQHADLLEPDFWNRTKARIAEGHIEDVFPYHPSRRFAARFGRPGPTR
ncbi:MAG: bifunctional isocitrate dehydrogenase kinase/phosphatase [Rhodocyclaceae bacterium]|nr:bifunctional isocitrate dehydrogenase kinase/phosphatase [Rhodocyclaceae bacterium]MCA3134878.1 bifunctional isocitrate dehydrogenase kinase/phosphatase [Rhodocyclaceae bacterium]MCA3146351.1 bifunctional isocitrate dehydrogenase kinase/phosphatase [Rhodocyclaceae bacterium]